MIRLGQRIGLILALAACTSTAAVDDHTSSVQVTVISGGVGAAPATYQVMIDNTAAKTVQANHDESIPKVRPGVHDVRLTDVPTNCTPDWIAPQSVTVTADAPATVKFYVDCGVPVRGRLIYTIYSLPNTSADIYSMLPDGSDVRRLTIGHNASHPVVSPGGTNVAFVELGHLWLMSVDGTNVRQLTTGAASDDAPNWSPDGTHLVFIRGAAGQLTTVTADGRLTASLLTGAGTPTWSPDTNRIAYVRDQQIQVIDLRTGTYTNVRAPNNSGIAENPMWTPTGNALYYVTRLGGDTTAIGLVNRNGGGDAIIYRTKLAYLFDGALSPSGDEIAFAGILLTSYSDVYVLKLPNTLLSNLTTHPGQTVFRTPSWTP